MVIKNNDESIEKLLTLARTLIVSVENDMSLGCLSTVSNESIIERLKQIDEVILQIEEKFGYDASFLITHSAYVTMAKRKHVY